MDSGWNGYFSQKYHGHVKLLTGLEHISKDDPTFLPLFEKVKLSLQTHIDQDVREIEDGLRKRLEENVHNTL